MPAELRFPLTWASAKVVFSVVCLTKIAKKMGKKTAEFECEGRRRHQLQPLSTPLYKHCSGSAIRKSPHLSLQSGHDLLAGLHHGVQLPRHHDGQPLVFGQGELQVGAGLVHDVHAHLRLVSLPKLVDVLVLALLQRHVENLRRQRERGGGVSHQEWQHFDVWNRRRFQLVL